MGFISAWRSGCDMPQPLKGPRLYLDPRRRTWAIRDGDSFIRLGLMADQEERAKQALTTYTNRKNRNRIERTIYFVTCDMPDFPIKIGISNDGRLSGT